MAYLFRPGEIVKRCDDSKQIGIVVSVRPLIVRAGVSATATRHHLWEPVEVSERIVVRPWTVRKGNPDDSGS